MAVSYVVNQIYHKDAVTKQYFELESTIPLMGQYFNVESKTYYYKKMNLFNCFILHNAGPNI